MNRHLTYVIEARRRWSDAEWIVGHGRFASVAFCRVTTVVLCETVAEAEMAKRRIDRMGCGGFCGGMHDIVPLVARLRKAS